MVILSYQNNRKKRSPMLHHPVTRRRVLGTLGTAALAAAPAVRAQNPRSARSVAVAQVADLSPLRQDVSKDFLIGARAAWQDFNARGGLRGRPVQHLTLEVDGSTASLRGALAQVQDNPAVVALSGTVSGAAAAQLAGLLRTAAVPLAHVAPWLQDVNEIDAQTFPIFATRQEQIGHALRSLSTLGVRELGAVFATPQDRAQHHDGVRTAAEALQLRLQVFEPVPDLRDLGLRLTPGTPAIVLFVGGTPELARFTQGLERQSRQRYLVALADVNLQTLQQMGAARHTPVIATQTVPMTTASLPVVRAYRDALARLFDEPPSPLSLAGFMAARYTQQVLVESDGATDRAGTLAAFQRRAVQDLGGFRVAFNGRRPGNGYVTQSMLTTDGRVIG